MGNDECAEIANPNIWSGFKKAFEKISRIERDPVSGLKITEHLENERILLESGEILDKQGNLWGWRVYKGEGEWDYLQGKSKNNPWNNQEDYSQAIKKFLDGGESGIVGFEQSFMGQPAPEANIFEQLTVMQLLLEGRYDIKLGSSWSRSREVAEYWAGRWPNSAVLVKDVPITKAVSAEALTARDPRFNTVIGVHQKEREITVFDYVDRTTVREVIPPSGIRSSSANYPKMPDLFYSNQSNIDIQDRRAVY